MDELHHWDVEDEFSLEQAAALIAGVDPLREDRTSHEQSRVAMILRRLERDAHNAAKTVFAEAKRAIAAVPDLGPTTPVQEVWAVVSTSVNQMPVRMAPLSQESISHLQVMSTGYPLPAEPPRMIGRLELARWIFLTGITSKYLFATQPPSIVIPLEAPSDDFRTTLRRSGHPAAELLDEIAAVEVDEVEEPAFPMQVDTISDRASQSSPTPNGKTPPTLSDQQCIEVAYLFRKERNKAALGRRFGVHSKTIAKALERAEKLK